MTTTTFTLNRAALGAWYERTYPQMLTHARRLLRDEQRAADAIQAAYCRLLEKAEHYGFVDPEADDKIALLRALVRYGCYSERKHQAQVGLNDPVGPEGCWERRSLYSDRREPAPDRIAEENELRAWLEAELAGLSPVQLEALGDWLDRMPWDGIRQLLKDGQFQQLELRELARLWGQRHGPFSAALEVDGERHYLGTFTTREEALLATRAFWQARGVQDFMEAPLTPT